MTDDVESVNWSDSSSCKLDELASFNARKPPPPVLICELALLILPLCIRGKVELALAVEPLLVAGAGALP